jgi:hypothetical protein
LQQGDSLLTGILPDQAVLYRVLAHIRDFNLELVEL